MNLGELRAAVRRQTQTQEDELPNATIDGYLQEAFDRTIADENDWPFFEQTWTLEVEAGETSVTLPGDVNTAGGFTSLRDLSTGVRLEQIGSGVADVWFGDLEPATVKPIYYSVWNRELTLWPPISYDSTRQYRLIAHRLPANWLTGVATDEPDCDSRFHPALVNYAISLAYIQQEDEVLEDRYMVRWQMDVDRIARSIMEPNRNRPLVVGPRFTTPVGGYRSRM